MEEALEGLYGALVNESRWIAPSIALASVLAVRTLRATSGPDDKVAAALSVYAGAMIGTMALGHLLAIALKLAVEGLDGPLPLLLGIGVVLVVPAWLVVSHGWALGRGEAKVGHTTIGLNLLLVAALLVTGPLNAPLAVPAALNAIHTVARTTRLKRATAVAAVLFSVLLFAGSVRFFVSGESFEDFSQMEDPTELS